MKRILLMLLLLVPSVSAAGADFYVTDIAPTKVYPGETTQLNITLKNLGTNFAAYLRAVLDPDDTSPLDALDSSKKYLSRAEVAEDSGEYFGAVRQLQDISVKYLIKVDVNATTISHNVPLNLIWNDEYGVEQTQTIYLGIVVIGEPNLIIAGTNTTPERIYANTEFTLHIDLENTGTAKAKSVEASLTLPEGITGEDIAYLGTIKRDTTARASYVMKVGKTAKSGAYDLTLNTSYVNEESTPGSVEKPFKIYVSESGDIDLEIAGVSTSPAKIYPGTDFTLSIQLENIGTQDAKSVMAAISNSEGFTGEFSSFIGKIEEDDVSSGIFDLTATPAIAAGDHEFNLEIIYTDERGQESSEIKTFNVYIDEPGNGSLAGKLAFVLILGAVALVIWRRRKAAQVEDIE